MKISSKHVILLSVSSILIVISLAARFSTNFSSWYAYKVYPMLSSGLSWFSSIFPFSIYDLFIASLILFVIALIGFIIFKRLSVKKGIIIILYASVMLYGSFYLLWGINYFKHDFYRLNKITSREYNEKAFKRFLISYVDSLNASYSDQDSVSLSTLRQETMLGFSKLKKSFKLNMPSSHLRVKEMMFSDTYAAMGIKGYYGPYFGEPHLNKHLNPWQLPFTYIHEVAHHTGVTGEAECNFYAYLICTNSDNPAIRFSGYFSLMPYVLSNANSVLSETEFKDLLTKIDPKVALRYKFTRQQWRDLYSPLIGDVQDVLYDWFLKGNNIESGVHNYAQVIAMLISFQASKAE